MSIAQALKHMFIGDQAVKHMPSDQALKYMPSGQALKCMARH